MIEILLREEGVLMRLLLVTCHLAIGCGEVL
jgi:hypothetical protein